MGCQMSRTNPTVIVVQPPDDPVKIRLRLRGPGPVEPDIGEFILAKLCEISDEFANRFQVTPTEKVDVYMAKLLPMEGDETGTINRISRKIINQAVGRGIPIKNNCKIIGAKEYQEAGDL